MHSAVLAFALWVQMFIRQGHSLNAFHYSALGLYLHLSGLLNAITSCRDEGWCGFGVREAADLERHEHFPSGVWAEPVGSPAKLCHPQGNPKNGSGWSEHPSPQKRVKSVLRNPVVRRRWAQDRVERWGKVLEWNSQGQKLRLRSLSRCPSSPSAVQVTALERGGRECGQRLGGVPVDCLHKGD